jgi:nifR3 family TIM-barrel protein
MNRGFWDKLKKPIFVLAPMADVTDAAFRELIAKYGKPDVFWTEFVSVDGLDSPGKEKLLVDFQYSENEHPIVAQIFGSKPEKFFNAVKIIKELGFDGVDINMGCPVKKVLNQNSCSALIRTPVLAKEIIAATKEAADELPVSVKTRIGFNKIEIDTWIPALLEMKLAALTLHLRTVKEMSLVPAHWELMPEIVKLAKTLAPETLILGNGDVKDLVEAQQKVDETGCDGIMIGRGIFGNPWLFSGKQVSLNERLKVMIEHTKLFEKKFAGIKNFEIMKKHYKAYVNGFDGAKELRTKLMEAKNSSEVQNLVEEYFVKEKVL